MRLQLIKNSNLGQQMRLIASVDTRHGRILSLEESNRPGGMCEFCDWQPHAGQ